jgi:uncharacterized membrane protein
MIELIGRLHPLVVHLPIGVFVLAFIMQYLVPLKGGRAELIRFILVVSLVFSVLAAVMGWVLSWEADYSQALIDKHKWPAIYFTVASGLLIPLQIKASANAVLQKFYHGLFFVSMGLLLVAGHRGGNLTHGEDFLSMTAFQQEDEVVDSVRVKPDLSASAFTPVFAGLVEPVLEAKCVKCHNEKKLKGGLRMDQFKLLMKGGKNGAAVVAGDAENSLMLERILLDIDDEKHMPPKGKKQLTEQELALLYWWVDHGASATDPIKDHVDNDTIRPFLAVRVEQAKEELLPEVKTPDSLAVVALVKAGFHVTPVAKGSHLLEISSINMPGLKDAELALLKPVAENVLWLHLAGRGITDDAMTHISGCVNLRRLDLRNTRVGDGVAAAISKLGSLEYLNMVGTGLTDAGLAKIGTLQALRHLYCWDTRVTPAGLESYRRSSPGTKVYQDVR